MFLPKLPGIVFGVPKKSITIRARIITNYHICPLPFKTASGALCGRRFRVLFLDRAPFGKQIEGA